MAFEGSTSSLDLGGWTSDTDSDRTVDFSTPSLSGGVQDDINPVASGPDNLPFPDGIDLNVPIDAAEVDMAETHFRAQSLMLNSHQPGDDFLDFLPPLEDTDVVDMAQLFDIDGASEPTRDMDPVATGLNALSPNLGPLSTAPSRRGVLRDSNENVMDGAVYDDFSCSDPVNFGVGWDEGATSLVGEFTQDIQQYGLEPAGWVPDLNLELDFGYVVPENGFTDTPTTDTQHQQSHSVPNVDLSDAELDELIKSYMEIDQRALDIYNPFSQPSSNFPPHDGDFEPDFASYVTNDATNDLAASAPTSVTDLAATNRPDVKPTGRLSMSTAAQQTGSSLVPPPLFSSGNNATASTRSSDLFEAQAQLRNPFIGYTRVFGHPTLPPQQPPIDPFSDPPLPVLPSNDEFDFRYPPPWTVGSVLNSRGEPIDLTQDFATASETDSRSSQSSIGGSNNYQLRQISDRRSPSKRKMIARLCDRTKELLAIVEAGQGNDSEPSSVSSPSDAERSKRRRISRHHSSGRTAMQSRRQDHDRHQQSMEANTHALHRPGVVLAPGRELYRLVQGGSQMGYFCAYPQFTTARPVIVADRGRIQNAQSTFHAANTHTSRNRIVTVSEQSATSSSQVRSNTTQPPIVCWV